MARRVLRPFDKERTRVCEGGAIYLGQPQEGGIIGMALGICKRQIGPAAQESRATLGPAHLRWKLLPATNPALRGHLLAKRALLTCEGQWRRPSYLPPLMAASLSSRSRSTAARWRASKWADPGLQRPIPGRCPPRSIHGQGHSASR